jgi:thiol-disulfide isomerase/thioredoxin
MKNLYKSLLSVIMIVSFFISVDSIAGDRLVLVERYTSSTCGPCATANPTLDNLLNNTDPSKLTSISYHMNWPAPGNDPMFLFNQSDNTGRRNYYGVNAIPYWKTDGIIDVGTGTVGNSYTTRSTVMSPVTIITTYTIVGDSMKVTAKVFCEDILTDPNVTVYLALVEKEIQYPSPPGTNGESHFMDVMRKMYPTFAGTKFTIFPGQTVVLEGSFYMDPIYEENEMQPLVFVQANNKEILNAGVPTFDYTLLSDLAYKVVDQGQNASGDFEISVPVVANGYNETVTLSADVQPNNPGVTVSFPNGNTVSSFPGDVLLRVNSTSAVPTGVYKVTVSGTNASTEEHKIVVSYLVGKNYVSVGANRPQVIYSVDNVTYPSLRMFVWDINATHDLSVATPQTFGNVRYVFENWSNGSNNPAQTITVNSATSNYTANFKTQFKLTTFTSPGGLPVTITHANEYLDSGSVVDVSITPTTVVHNGQTFYFKNWIGAGNGSYTGTNSSFQIASMDNFINQVAVFDTITSVSQLGSEIPDKYELYQNYPNPFNPETVIKFDIPKAGIVKLAIFNILGEQVDVLHDGFLNYGRFESSWNASSLPSGVYFYKLETEDFVSIKKLVLLK